MLGGHSFGELVALHAAGVVDAAGLAELASERGRLMKEAGAGNGRDGGPAGRRLDDVDRVDPRTFPEFRSPTGTAPAQTVIAGPAAAVNEAIELAAEPRNRRPAAARLECVSHADGRLGAPSRSNVSPGACSANRPTGPSTRTSTRLLTLLFPPRSPLGWETISPARCGLAR